MLAWGSALVFRINNSPVGMAAQRRWRRFRARYFPGPHDAETDDTGMDEMELAEEAHRLRLKLLLAEEEEAAILLSLAANKVLFTVKRLSVFCVLCRGSTWPLESHSCKADLHLHVIECCSVHAFRRPKCIEQRTHAQTH
jgi:hypothetical protein